MDINHVDTMPEYIKSFIKSNMEQLNTIYDAGYQNNNNEGCLGMNCSIDQNKMDVFFMDKDLVLKYISSETYEKIKSDSNDKKVYLINDLDINSLFIIYI